MKNFTESVQEIRLGPISRHGGAEMSEWAENFVTTNIIESCETVCTLRSEINVSPETDLQEFMKKILSFVSDYRLISKTKTRSGGEVGLFFADNEKTFLRTFFTKSDNEVFIELSVVSNSEELINNINGYMNLIAKISKKNNVYVIATSESGLSLHSLGPMSSELVADNYTKETIDTYNHIVKQYSSPTPNGRLSIINGPPGTGKTFLVRSLVSAIKNCIIVLLPTKLVSEIDSPNLISLLVKEKGEFGMLTDDPLTGGATANKKETPVLFVIEDADICLVPREQDNSSLISSVLNYTDGIFGSMLDLRIIATTNAHHIDFDEALKRPGRLCKHLYIDKLKPEKAMEVYKRLTGKDKTYINDMTLAEIYADANGTLDEKEVVKSAPKLGFT